MPQVTDKSLLILIGPTATGKTNTALRLARAMNGELISADSRQVYKGLDIGTGKVSPNSKVQKENGYWIVDGIPIYLFDVADLQDQFSVADFVKLASERVEKIWSKNKLPIVVGGTGFYISGLLGKIESLGIGPDWGSRKKLEQKSLDELLTTLQKLNSKKAAGLNQSDRSNKRRLIRSIEIEKSAINIPAKTLSFDRLLILGLTASNEYLFERIDDWIEKRVTMGMIEETKKLHSLGLSYKRMEELGLEYLYLSKLLKGEITKEEFLKGLKNASHDYARRQKIYFTKFPETVWVDAEKEESKEKLFNSALRWYNKK